MNPQFFLCSKLHYLPKKVINNLTRTATFQVRKYSESHNVEEIVIPAKIPRGPTDILRALESTVGKDYTAAHYKYHDDPYLIPQSNLGKRSLALAQEAGRKAAYWVRKENADLFQHREADPFIDKFAPPKFYDENTEVTIEDLEDCIKNCSVSDAIIVYKSLMKNSVEINPELQQRLLELLCFFNSSDSVSEEFIEERWFRQSAKGDEKQRKTWKDGAFAEEVFISIKEPDAKTYSAIIQGMVKYYQINRATQLFEEAKQKGLVLNVDTYNSMIEAGNLLKENYDMRWGYIVQLLREMNEKKLKPNLGTLNAVLYCLGSMGVKFTRDVSLEVLAEFKKLGVEPSLASWYFLLQIFCKERGPTSTILIDILNEIENKEHTIRDIRDVNFFLTAMNICRYHLNDLGVAKRVDNLLHFGNNYDLIGDSYRESVYYRHFMILSVVSEPIHDFMQNVYEKIVPNIYTPEVGVMEEIVKQIEVSGAIEYLPKIWSDIVTFDYARRENILNLILDVMINNQPKNDPDLTEKFANVASDIHERLMGQEEMKTNKITVTGNMLGSILQLLLRNKSFDNAWNVFRTLDKEHQKIIGNPNYDALAELVDACIEEKRPSNALSVIQYATDGCYENVDKLAVKLQEKLTLDEVFKEKLGKIVGQHVIVDK